MSADPLLEDFKLTGAKPVEIECPVCHAWAENEDDHCGWCQDRQFVSVVPVEFIYSDRARP